MTDRTPIVIDCDWPEDLAECENWHGAATFARIHKRAELRDIQGWMRDLRKAQFAKEAAERQARHQAPIEKAQAEAKARKAANVQATEQESRRRLEILKAMVREHMGNPEAREFFSEFYARCDAIDARPQLKVVSNV